MTFRKTLAMVEFCVGPSFIRSDVLGPTLHDRIKSGRLTDICDSNNNPLIMKGTVQFPIQLGQFLVYINLLPRR